MSDTTLTLKERVRELEMKEELMNQKLDIITKQIDSLTKSIEHVSKKLDEMAPVVENVMLVKGYGSMTWKFLKWLGGITLAIIVSWPQIKNFYNWLIR